MADTNGRKSAVKARRAARKASLAAARSAILSTLGIYGKQGHAKKALELKKSGWKSFKLFLKIYRRDGGKCFWCRRSLRWEDYLDSHYCASQRKTGCSVIDKSLVDPEMVPNKDHVQPKSKGGGSGMNNLVLSCRKCNTAKGDGFLNPVTGKLISVQVIQCLLKCEGE